MLRFQSSSDVSSNGGCGGDAGIGDDDVDAAIGENGFAERGVDRGLAGHVHMNAVDHVLAESFAELARPSHRGSARRCRRARRRRPRP